MRNWILEIWKNKRLSYELISDYVKEKAWSLFYLIAWCLGVFAEDIAVLLLSYFGSEYMKFIAYIRYQIICLTY